MAATQQTDSMAAQKMADYLLGFLSEEETGLSKYKKSRIKTVLKALEAHARGEYFNLNLLPFQEQEEPECLSFAYSYAWMCEQWLQGVYSADCVLDHADFVEKYR